MLGIKHVYGCGMDVLSLNVLIYPNVIAVGTCAIRGVRSLELHELDTIYRVVFLRLLFPTSGCAWRMRGVVV